MTIVSLTSENVKKLKAVHVAPNGGHGLVIIGGRNGQGKTSVLDSIEMALGGTKSVPKRPVRDGQSKAEIILETEDLIVTRTFSQRGSTINVVGRDGMRKASPQTLLDGLVGSLSFDPLAFARMKPGEQAGLLRELTGLDFSELDKRRQAAYDERTAVNREVKSAQEHLAQLKAAVPDGDYPSELVSVSNLVGELREAETKNRQNAEFRQAVDAKAQGVETKRLRMAALLREVDELRKGIDIDDKKLERMRADLAALEDIPTETIQNAIANAGEVNEVVQAIRAASQAAGLHDKRKARSEELTKEIEAIDAEKQKRLSECAMPLDGLGFDDTGVTYGGLPFEQLCDSEKLKVSLAMGLKMNPALRVVLIRDGSLLDSDSLALVAEMAEQANAQVWIERVGEGDEGAVIIEDGSVKA
jgi:DNA repair exonuclease SbcCD ATPase subunit